MSGRPHVHREGALTCLPSVAFVAMIPLQSILQFGGMQMMAYLGVQLGELLMVTLCKSVTTGPSLPRIVLTPH